MKKLSKHIPVYILAFLLTASNHLFSQSPNSISYQAVVRDNSGSILSEQRIGVRISIIAYSTDGTEVYIETHSTSSNRNGLISLHIGEGAIISGNFGSIDWSNGPYFMKTEIAPNENNIYTISGISQILSVPYALHATTADHISGINLEIASNINHMDITNWNKKLSFEVDGDTLNELQQLHIEGNTISLSKANSITLPTNENTFDGNYESLSGSPKMLSQFTNDMGFLSEETDGDSLNEIQTLAIIGDTINISKGNSIILPPTPSKLSQLENDLTFVIQEQDADSTNELQSLAIIADTISISNGNKIIIPHQPTNTSQLINDSGFITEEEDGDKTNELQTLSITRNTISISNGNSISLPQFPLNVSELFNDKGYLTEEIDDDTTNEIQQLSINGNEISISDGNSIELPEFPSKLSQFQNDIGFLTEEVDKDTTNEIQLLSISGNEISISDGNSIELPEFPTKLSQFQDDIGFLTEEFDKDTTNELQQLSISGNKVSISGGNTIALPELPSKLSQLQDDIGFLTEEIDKDSTNEIQALSIIADSIFISKGNAIKLPEQTHENLTLTLEEGADAGGITITNLGEPNESKDAVTKAYADRTEKRLNTFISGVTQLLFQDGKDMTQLTSVGIHESMLLDAGVPLNDLISNKANLDSLIKYGIPTQELAESGVWITLLESKGKTEELTALGYIGTVADADSNVYKWMKFGDQIWMTENLRTSIFNDDSPISYNTPSHSINYPAFCWLYNDTANKTPYGGYYNYAAVATGKLCPKGWHVSSLQDWAIFKTYLQQSGFSISQTESKTAKSIASTSGWDTSFTLGSVGYNQEENNTSGFNAVPTGYVNGSFSYQNSYALWWMFDETGSEKKDSHINSNGSEIFSNTRGQEIGFPVRCVKD